MPDNINDLFGALSPDEAQKERIAMAIETATQTKTKTRWLRPAVACGAFVAVLACVVAARPLWQRPAELTTQPTVSATQPGDEIVPFTLPPRLAGQAATWETNTTKDRPSVTCTLRNGAAIEFPVEEIFRGSKTEYDAYIAAHPECVDFEPSSEPGGVMSYYSERAGRYPNDGHEAHDASELIWEIALYCVRNPDPMPEAAKNVMGIFFAEGTSAPTAP